MLEVRMLGHFAVYRTERSAAVRFPNETVRRLCKFLMLHRNEPQTADALLDACWPADARPTRTALHVAISRLRRCLEPDLAQPMHSRFVLRQRSAYMFVPGTDCRLDVADYEQWADVADAKAAAGDWGGVVSAVTAAESVVRGDLLACEPYADWAGPARVRFQQRRTDVLELCLTAHARLGQWPPLIRLARRILAEDNTREYAYRSLMRAYAVTGERGRALAVFDDCRRALITELGVEPSPATVSLYRDLLGEEQPAPDASAAAVPPRPVDVPARTPTAPSGLAALQRTALGPLALPLAGRDRALPHIRQLLMQGGFVVLAGEAGVGKSRLASEVLTGLAAAGCDVLAGQCVPHGRSRPFQPLVEALGPLWLDGADDGAARPPLMLADAPGRLFSAALARLQSAAARKHVIICLDDAHLADPDTLSFVSQLLRHVGPQPGGGCLSVLATARSEAFAAATPWFDCVAMARRLGMLHEIAVGPLTVAGIERMLAARAAEPAAKRARLARELHADSAGVALFAVERLHALLKMGRITVTAAERWQWPDELSLADLAPPAVAHDLARQRTAGLRPAARNVLDACLVLRRDAPFAWLAAIAGGEPRDVLSGLEELLQRHVLIPIDKDGHATYSVGHHLICEALYRALLPERRAHLHTAAGHALARLHAPDQPVPPALIADQFERGGAATLAVAWHRRAASSARAAAAFGEADQRLQQALRLARHTGDAALVSGCCEDLAELTATTGGWSDAARDLYAEAFAHARTPADRARISLRWATACLAADEQQALSLAVRAETIARDVHDREREIWALALQAAVHKQAGRSADSMRCADAAVAAFNRADATPGTAPEPLTAAGAHRLPAVRFEAIWTATKLLRKVGSSAGEIAGTLYLADVAALSARWPETEAWARYVLSLTDADEEEHALATVCLAWIASRQGDHDRCRASLEPLIARAAARRWAGLLMVSHLLLISSLADQEHIAAAHALLDEAAAAADSVGDLRSQVMTRYLRAYVHWCAGEHAAACHAAEAALAHGAGHLQRLDLVLVRRILGIAQVGLGEWQAALALATENFITAEAAGMLLDAALALGVKGYCQALLGDRERGRAAVVEAIARLNSLGARRSAREAQAMLAHIDAGGLPAAAAPG